jgi:uncharacterized protein YndB with AHSA1/START domain
MGKPDKWAGLGDEAVQKATGKTWAQWLTLLDGDDAAKMTHAQIAMHLYEKYHCPDWWCQMVTVGYEQARGRREKHQKPDGFSISGSKTLAVPLATAFTAWTDETRRQRWLPGVAFTVRKATANKSLRITWTDGTTSVEVNFYAKGEKKSQVSVQHNKLPDAKRAEEMKAYWAAALERLKAVVEGA